MKKFGTNDTPFLAPNGDVTDGAPEELNRPTNQFFNNVYGSLKRFIEGAGLALTDANGTSPNLDLLKNASIAMRQNQTATALKTTGTSTAYAGSVTTAPTANANDLRVFVEFHTASGANPTFNLNALGALPLKQIDSAGNKVAAVVFNGMKSDVVCDGTNWMMLDAVYQASDAGLIAFFASNSAPTGYLKANGAAISRASYATLFAAIGTTFGAGDGSTTFNLPDLRGQFLRGWDDGRGLDAGRGFGTVQLDALQNHAHTGTTYFTGLYSAISANGHAVYVANNTGQMSSGNSAWETRPRNVALLACIKY